MRASSRAFTAPLVSFLVLGVLACSSRSITHGAAGSGADAGLAGSSSAGRAGTSKGGTGGASSANGGTAGAHAIENSGGTAGVGEMGGGSGHDGGAPQGGGGTQGTAGSQGGLGTSNGGSNVGGTSSLRGGAGGSIATSAGGGTSQGGGNTNRGGSAGTAGNVVAQGGMAPGRCNVASDCSGVFNQTYCASATCDAGFCRSVPLAAISQPTCTGGCANSTATTTGFWDGDVPYVLYVPPRGTATSETIAIQRLRLDSTNYGVYAPFALSATLKPPTRLAATMSGTSLGILFGAELMNSAGAVVSDTTQFALTTPAGTAATPIVMTSTTVASEYTYPALQLYAVPRANGEWLLAQLGGDPIGYWDGISGALAATTRFSRIAGLFDDHAALQVFDDVVMVSGHASAYWRTPGTANILVRRYSVTDFSLLGTDIVLESITKGTVGTEPAAMVRLAAGVGVMWNVTTSSATTLGTAIIAKDGSFVKSPASGSSTLIAKALVPNPKGGALLVASQIDTTALPMRFTPVVQNLSATLVPVGTPYAIGPTTAYDIQTVAASNSADGKKTLITFVREGDSSIWGAYRRIVDSALCQ